MGYPPESSVRSSWFTAMTAVLYFRRESLRYRQELFRSRSIKKVFSIRQMNFLTLLIKPDIARRSMIPKRVRDGNSVSRRCSESRLVSRSDQKDIENGQVVVVRRDTREKIVVAIDEITTKLGEILETIQADFMRKQKRSLMTTSVLR